MRNKLAQEPKLNFFPAPKKSLGQNFLIDRAVLEKIVAAGELKQDDWVLEIGPGRGFLTQVLLAKAGRVAAIEKDEILAEELKKIFAKEIQQGRLKILTGDALEFDWEDFLVKEGIGSYKLIANIPYYITGKIFRIFQEAERRPVWAVFLIQKEVAERIVAPVGQKSRLAIAAEYFSRNEIVGRVDRKSFFPVPGVDSAILKMVFRKPEDLPHQGNSDRKNFFRLVKVGFASRRKTLFNNLKAVYDQELIICGLSGLNLDLKIRAQALSLEDWLGLDKFLRT